MLQVIPWISSVGCLRWSPDGTQLAGTMRCAPQDSQRSAIFVIKADGTRQGAVRALAGRRLGQVRVWAGHTGTA